MATSLVRVRAGVKVRAGVSVGVGVRARVRVRVRVRVSWDLGWGEPLLVLEPTRAQQRRRLGVDLDLLRSG